MKQNIYKEQNPKKDMEQKHPFGYTYKEVELVNKEIEENE
jgi:hypothetical protein